MRAIPEGVSASVPQAELEDFDDVQVVEPTGGRPSFAALRDLRVR